jgi:DNA-binding PadR family transcriptional regulator
MDERDERVLLLLGLLSTQDQHGYQINEFIERNLGRVTQMRKATAYALLERMAAAGLVKSSIEQEGNRPVRRVYSITLEGQKALDRMLRDIIAKPEIAAPPADIALMFIDHLSGPDINRVFRERVAHLNDVIAALEAMPSHSVGIGVDLSIRRRLALLKVDRDWFEGISRSFAVEEDAGSG